VSLWLPHVCPHVWVLIAPRCGYRAGLLGLLCLLRGSSLPAEIVPNTELCSGVPPPGKVGVPHPLLGLQPDPAWAGETSQRHSLTDIQKGDVP
jgi:hypothetical protein